MNRTEAYMILNSLRLVGPVRVRKMLEVVGSPEAILAEKGTRLAKIEGIGQAVADSIINWETQWNLAQEWMQIEKLGFEIIDCEDDAYPNLLKEIYDPPLVLYTKGNKEALKRLSIGVVGSRRTSRYGSEMAKKLSYQMSYAGLSVVSGLARGIDTYAHQGALAAKGVTIAVQGCSLEKIYPPENQALATKMIEENGLIISEFPLGTTPDKQTFPMRNRIVSGLCSGVLVIEAGKDSGALITARRATEQGRTVFAVPGRIDQPYAAGCHRLIKDGAKLVEGVNDILEEFEFIFPQDTVKPKRFLPEDLNELEKLILENLGDEEMQLDVLIQKCTLPAAKVSTTLLRLEMRKLVQQLPGKVFVRTD
ncbi:MAG: DNA-processing protein DprA [Verrucomicrobiota bacterium]